MELNGCERYGEQAQGPKTDWLSLFSGGSFLIRALFTCWPALGSLEVKDSIPLRQLSSCTGRGTIPGIISSLKRRPCFPPTVSLNKLETIPGLPPPICAYHHALGPGTGCCSTCTVLFNPYYKYKTWVFHYYPDNWDEKTEVSWLCPNHTGKKHSISNSPNELNIYFMHLCARY